MRSKHLTAGEESCDKKINGDAWVFLFYAAWTVCSVQKVAFHVDH